MQNERKVVELNLNDVLPNRFQPRIKFDENSINELAESIKKYGVIQPIVVRKIGERYEIIAGERRYKASVIAGRTTIPAIISEMSDKDSIEIALIENVQREDLTPIEKAISYKKILDMGYISQEALAQKVGKSQSSIANTLRLLNLSEEVQEALLESKISERHARSLLKIKDEKNQVSMLNRIINERLTVRKTDEEIDKMYNEIINNNQPEEQPVNIQEEVVTIPDFESEYKSSGPSFMDIDQIQNQAENIVKEERPVADVDNLLKIESAENPVIPQEKDEDLLRPGKFFSFGEETEEDTETGAAKTIDFINPAPFIPTQTDEMLSNLNMTNSPNFEVPQTLSSVDDKTELTFDSPASVISTVEDTPINLDFEPFKNEFSTFEPVAPSFEAPQTETPTFEPVAPSFEAPQTETPTFEPVAPSFEAPQTETPTFEPVTPSFEAPQIDTSGYEPVASNFEAPQVETISYEPEAPVYEAPQEQINVSNDMPVMPSFEALQQAISPNSFDFGTMNGVVDNNQINKDFHQPMPTSTRNTDIKTAIDKTRTFQKELETLGYEIDLEEIDFEDSYQVIIRISK